MKKLENLKGAQKLSKNEQQSINGGHVEPCQGMNWILLGNYPQAECLGFGNTEWYSGKCYYCH